MNRPKFKTVKQPRGSRSCVAAAVAMASDNTLEAVEAQLPVSHNESGEMYYSMKDARRFLCNQGIDTGAIFDLKAGTHCDRKDIIKICWDFSGNVAMLTVASDILPGEFHCVLWDGKKVRDPNPDVKGTTKLGAYSIYDVVPLYYEDDR